MINKVKNKKLNMFVRNNEKKRSCKKEKHKVTLFMRAKSKKHKVMFR
jgi:hypothetical protein